MTDSELKEQIEREEAAMKSLVFFREAFIPSSDDVPPASFHHEWSDILLNGKEHFAVEAFRESAKTQIVIRANLLHALTYPKATRSYLVVICATQRTASKKLLEVSREYLSNPAMTSLMSGVRENSGLAFEVSYITGQSVRIEAYGKGAAVRGLSWGAKRPDLVIIDDPQDEEDARSEAVTASDWDWFLSDVYFLGQASRIFIIGNNLGERCIMESIMRNSERLKFTARKIPILTAEGQSAWPEKWPLEAIEKEREEFAALGKTDLWHRNKMCECISPDSQKFKREYFKYYDERALDLRGMNIYTAVDLAISDKPNADCSAIVTVGVNAAGHWFVLDVEYGRYDPSTTMDAVFSAVKKWQPLSVGIETAAYQKALVHFLEKEMPSRGIFFRITTLKAGNAKDAKNLRIDTLQPRFAVGTVWFKSGAAWLNKIESELLAYPHGAHDDVIDALAYIEQMSTKPYGYSVYEGGVNEDWNPIAGRM